MIDQDELTVLLWRQRCSLWDADDEIRSLRGFQSQRRDWLRFNRKGLLFSSVQAAALGCELVYAIRPRDRKTFVESSWARLSDTVDAKVARQICLHHMRARLKIAIASHLLGSAQNLKRFRLNRRLRL